MLPNYQQLMRPVLEVAKDKEVKLSDAVEILSNRLGLDEAQRTAKLPSGRQTNIANRVGWAKTYLIKAGLLETNKRAHFNITAQGIAALADANVEINNAYLKQFDSFNSFINTKKPVDSGSNQIDTTPTADSETPDEALRAAYQQINQALRADILDKTRKVTPAFFEQLLIDLLIAMGYGVGAENTAHVLGKTGDNGIDGVINQDPLGVDQIYIQAKRYAQGNNVGAGDIRDFFGALNLKKAQKGLFITTSDFTASASQTAKNLGSRIVLINGEELAQLMLKYNIGCRDEQVLHLKKIDEVYFEG